MSRRESSPCQPCCHAFRRVGYAAWGWIIWGCATLRERNGISEKATPRRPSRFIEAQAARSASPAPAASAPTISSRALR